MQGSISHLKIFSKANKSKPEPNIQGNANRKIKEYTILEQSVSILHFKYKLTSNQKNKMVRRKNKIPKILNVGDLKHLFKKFITKQ